MEQSRQRKVLSLLKKRPFFEKLPETSKKLVSVSATSVSIIDNSGKDVVLKMVPYIYYSVWFQKGQEQVIALLNSGSEVNAISPAFVERLGLKIRKTNVGAQKIDGSTLETFKMVIADFQVEDKGGIPRFFQETFLVANTKFKVILGMPFLKLSNADVLFSKGKLMWKSYIINKLLPTTKRVQPIDL